MIISSKNVVASPDREVAGAAARTGADLETMGLAVAVVVVVVVVVVVATGAVAFG